jgi:hypothetical protein
MGEKRTYSRTDSSQSVHNLFHFLLGEIHQNTSHSTLTRLGLADGHIRIERDLRSISGIIAIRKTYFKGKGRVSHVQRSSRHIGDGVGIRVGVHKQLILPFAQEASSSSSGGAAIGVESCSKQDGFFNEYFAVNGPGRESLEGMTVKSSDLVVREDRSGVQYWQSKIVCTDACKSPHPSLTC